MIEDLLYGYVDKNKKNMETYPWIKLALKYIICRQNADLCAIKIITVIRGSNIMKNVLMISEDVKKDSF